ncbi:hypothetical protein V1478_008239 [Vespula squamosa]|uniref:Uncharacterized protein n=1 Tax=Vespula squamosa TaxID=30214 RepID=A0ABD2AY86_VESSQ
MVNSIVHGTRRVVRGFSLQFRGQGFGLFDDYVKLGFPVKSPVGYDHSYPAVYRSTRRGRFSTDYAVLLRDDVRCVRRYAHPSFSIVPTSSFATPNDQTREDEKGSENSDYDEYKTLFLHKGNIWQSQGCFTRRSSSSGRKLERSNISEPSSNVDMLLFLNMRSCRFAEEEEAGGGLVSGSARIPRNAPTARLPKVREDAMRKSRVSSVTLEICTSKTRTDLAGQPAIVIAGAGRIVAPVRRIRQDTFHQQTAPKEQEEGGNTEEEHRIGARERRSGNENERGFDSKRGRVAQKCSQFSDSDKDSESRKRERYEKKKAGRGA